MFSIRRALTGYRDESVIGFRFWVDLAFELGRSRADLELSKAHLCQSNRNYPVIYRQFHNANSIIIKLLKLLTASAISALQTTVNFPSRFIATPAVR